MSVSVDNGIRKYNYTVSLTAFAEIYVAGSSIRKGQDIAGLVHKERYELARVHGDPVKDVEGYIATRNIGTGRPITTGDVMKKPDAFKGTTVLIVFNSGALNVSTSGELEEDAYIGKKCPGEKCHQRQNCPRNIRRRTQGLRKRSVILACQPLLNLSIFGTLLVI